MNVITSRSSLLSYFSLNYIKITAFLQFYDANISVGLAVHFYQKEKCPSRRNQCIILIISIDLLEIRDISTLHQIERAKLS